MQYAISSTLYRSPETIQNSVACLIALSKEIKEINDFAHPSNDRENNNSIEVLKIAVYLSSLISNPNNDQKKIKFLEDIYKRKQGIQIPKLVTAVDGRLDFYEDSKGLPNPRDLLVKYGDEQHQEILTKEAIGLSEAQQQDLALQKYVLSLNIDLTKDITTLNNISFYVLPNNRILDSMIKFHDDLGELIKVKVLGGEKENINLFSLNESININTNQLTKLTINDLLKEYVKVREILVQLNKRRNTELSESISKVFNSNEDDKIEIISKLSQNEKNNSDLSKLILLGGLIKQGDHFTETLFLKNIKEIESLRIILKTYLYNEDNHSFENKFNDENLLKILKSFKEKLKEPKSLELSTILNNLLTGIIGKTNSNYFEKACVFLIVKILSEDKRIVSLLKGGVSSFHYFSELTALLHNEVKDYNRTNAFIGVSGKEVNRKFSHDLSDYLGQKSTVEKWKKDLSDNISILENPQLRQGLTNIEVFKNGFLLYGPPGTGKTFLVTCMANELGVPIINLEDENIPFAELLQKKIVEAEKAILDSGSTVAILFIDEIEQYFLNREKSIINQDEFSKVNKMLREIEGITKNHPNIILVGATNHKELIDEAALRIGRFGFHVKIDLPNSEELKEIYATLFSKNSLNVDESYLPALIEASKNATPEKIKLYLNRILIKNRIEGNSFDIQNLILSLND